MLSFSLRSSEVLPFRPHAPGFWYLPRIGPIFRMVAWPWYSPSMTTTGPMAQQPRQATVSSVNWPSLVVSPAGTSSLRSSSSRIFGPPRTWQAGAEADQARMLAARFEAEGPVERGHSDDVDEGHAQALGDLPQGVRGEVVEAFLDVEEDRNEVLLEALVVVDDRLDLRFVSVQIIPPVRGFHSESDVGELGAEAPGRRPGGGRAKKGRRAAFGRLPGSPSGDYGL